MQVTPQLLYAVIGELYVEREAYKQQALAQAQQIEQLKKAAATPVPTDEPTPPAE